MKQEEITLKNTKAEILEALNVALEREKKASKIKSNPEIEEKERKEKKAIETTKQNVEQNIFSQELINKFKDLEIAIEASEEKLKELYGIESEMSRLTLVVNAGKDFIANIEEKKKEETEKMTQSLKILEENYNKKAEELKKEYELKAKNLQIEREREQEEYNYKTKREREISNNEWEDQKKERERNLAQMESEAKSLLEEVKVKEKNIKDLESQVNGIPTLLEKEYARGKSETTKELERDHKYEIELLKKDFQNQIDRQEDKITSLIEELEKERTRNVSLQEKMDKAYLELKELAAKTVETSGVVKIIGNNTSEVK